MKQFIKNNNTWEQIDPESTGRVTFNAVYVSHCKSFSLAKEITNITGNVSTGSASFKPPYCLRTVKNRRTKETQDFRNLVAKQLKQNRVNK